jgi:hypothetical protein
LGSFCSNDDVISMIVYGGFDSTCTYFFECWRIILVPCWWCGVVATPPDRIYAGLGKMQLLHKLRHRMRLLLDCGEEILVSFCSVSGELTSSVLTADFLFIAVQSQMTTSRTLSDEELLLLSCLSRRCSERKTVDKGHCENELWVFSFVFFNGLCAIITVVSKKSTLWRDQTPLHEQLMTMPFTECDNLSPWE